MSLPSDQSGPGVPERSSRLGPSLSLLGLALWVVTIALYVLLKPAPGVPGAPFRQETAIQLLLSLVLSGLGVFAAAIVSALGFFLSLSERRHRPGSRATRGVVLGALGIAALGIVVVEILRVALETT
ncbi:hypothetical protein [Tautonia marina]|uniref:hypothetical protein n=1 Tax=Tautonia marina TaxID=2653855 RepID=UPI001261049D|nr:hypothetical protein [Tautonia marina]